MAQISSNTLSITKKRGYKMIAKDLQVYSCPNCGAKVTKWKNNICICPICEETFTITNKT